MIVKIENVGLRDVSVGKRFAIQTISMFFILRKKESMGKLTNKSQRPGNIFVNFLEEEW